MNQILIVEDNLTQREFLCKVATQINHNIEVKNTPSAVEALKIAKKHEIKAFFIDIRLVDGNGIELAKKLRQLNKYKFTPIIFITAIITKEMEAFHYIHAYDYLIKPFSKNQLQKTMKNILIDYLKNNEKQENYLILDFRGIKQRLNLSDICYVEYRYRKIVIVTIFEEITYKHISIKKFINELDGRFIQVHQSFIVNKDFISKINLNNSEINIINIKTTIPIGISYKKKVKEFIDACI